MSWERKVCTQYEFIRLCNWCTHSTENVRACTANLWLKMRLLKNNVGLYWAWDNTSSVTEWFAGYVNSTKLVHIALLSELIKRQNFEANHSKFFWIMNINYAIVHPAFAFLGENLLTYFLEINGCAVCTGRCHFYDRTPFLVTIST